MRKALPCGDVMRRSLQERHCAIRDPVFEIWLQYEPRDPGDFFFDAFDSNYDFHKIAETGTGRILEVICLINEVSISLLMDINEHMALTLCDELWWIVW